MDYEFQALDKKEFEETRRFLFETAQSKHQKHLGYLITIVIASLTGSLATLVLQSDTFFNVIQKPNTTLLFFVIISVIAAVTFYMLKRTLFWNTYSSAVLNLSIQASKKLFLKYSSKENKKGLREQENPLTCILNVAVCQHLEDLQSRRKGLAWTTKLAVLDSKMTFMLCVEAGLIAFEALLVGFLFM